MENADEVNKKILKLINIINENYPELAKYLDEIPQTIPELRHPDVDVEKLAKYHEWLLDIFRSYVAGHQLSYANRTHNHHL